MNLSRRKFLVGLGATAAAVKIVPVAIAAPAAPVETAAGWLPCYGQSISRATYANLFAVIGKTYGADDDLTFNLPDLRSRYVFGIDDPQARPRVRHDFVISTTETSVPCGFIAQRWRSA
jgi:microcystin-dependent protein